MKTVGNVIYVNFPNHRPYSLKQAREFLGGGFFRKALFEWSMEELDRTLAHPEAVLTDAGDAYHAIYLFRQERLAHPGSKPLPPGPGAEIIQFQKRIERKAA